MYFEIALIYSRCKISHDVIVNVGYITDSQNSTDNSPFSANA